MLNYRTVTCGDISPLIPCTSSAMFRMFAKYRTDLDMKWTMRGVKPILDNNRFIQTIHKFEKDEGRAVRKDDVKSLVKDVKVEIAKKEGSSTMLVSSPYLRSINSYMIFLTQLDGNRSITATVQ